MQWLPGYTYIGETSRNLSTRLTKHKQAMRNGDINNHIVEPHSTGYYQRLTLESWFTNLEQTPQNNDLLTESGKTNYKQTTGQLTIWLTINDCLTVKTDGLKCTNGITSLHSQ